MTDLVVKEKVEENIFDKANEVFKTENDALKKANATLKINTAKLTAQYINLLYLYIANVFEVNNMTVPKGIDWKFSIEDIVNEKALSGSFEDKKVIVDIKNNIVKIEQLVVNEIKLGNSSENEKVEDIVDMPPFEEPLDINKLYEDEIKPNLDKYIRQAKGNGYSDAYFNADGTFNAPTNVATDIQVKVFSEKLSLDEFDEIIELVVNNYKGVNIIEDLNCINFVLDGGGCNE